MEIETRKEKNAFIVITKGKMDVNTAPELEKVLADSIAEGEKYFILDFGGLDYISSAGLRSIAAAHRRIKEKGGKLFLAALTHKVKEIFDISGFSSHIPTYQSVESVLAQV